jgi:hypothetical protein
MSSRPDACEICGAKDRLVPDLIRHFGVGVCWDCRVLRDEYGLVPKTRAQQHFLVPDRVLATWPSLEKENPKHEGWGKMRLFLRQTAMRWSYSKFDGPEGLEAERVRRAERRAAQLEGRSERKHPRQWLYGDDASTSRSAPAAARDAAERSAKRTKYAGGVQATLREEQRRRAEESRRADVIEISSGEESDGGAARAEAVSDAAAKDRWAAAIGDR